MAFTAPPFSHLSRSLHRLPRRLSPPRPSLSRFFCAATPLRGFKLLKSDLSKLSRLLRGDLRAILDRSFALYRYDPVAIAQYYDARPFSAFVRVTAIGVPFLIWLFRVRKLDAWARRQDDPTLASRRADQLRKLLTWAGPTYLKIGQAVGNRPDLVGVIYSNELQRLVDDVGTFDADVAKSMILDELRIDELDRVFSAFQPDAVASASLGQVHRATLLTGEEVAVKVQRPTVERDAALDVYVLRKAAAFAKKRFRLRSDLVGIVDEFATRLWEELDYVNEAGNCERFATLYATDNEDIYVPRIYRKFTTKRILCMEWVDGDKAPWLPKEDAKRLIRVGVQCSLQQLLDKGFVHADPHGGNLLRMRDGRLCYLDFGMCVEVAPQIRYDLVAAIVRLINRDYENLASDFVKLGFLPPDTDTRPFGPLLAKAFGDASTGRALSDLSFSRLADNLSGLAFATPIRIPVFFTLIIRSLTILEGFALQTDSSFKIVDESYPYVVKRVLTDDSPVFQKALEGVLVDDETGRIKWNRLDSLLKTRSSSLPEENGKANDTSGRSSRALAGMSNQALNRVIDFALSDRGGFLRKALQLELTDTADAIQLALAKQVSSASFGLIPPPSEDADLERVENAISLARELRTRAPEFLYAPRSEDRAVRRENRRREERLRKEIAEASRAVAGNMLDRNTRRLLRKAIASIFGDRTDES